MRSQHPFLHNNLVIPKDKKDAVDSIRSWLGFQPHLPNITDDMIMLFLHSCNFSLERAKDTIENYYSMRARCPEFFKNWNFDSLKETWEIAEMIPAPKLTSEGYQILIYRLKDLDPSLMNFNDMIKAFCAFNDIKISEDGKLMPGYVVVLDMKGITFGHFIRVTPYVQSIRYILLYLQECHPVRLKQVHVINTVSFMDKILSLAKPFIHSELMSILHLHGSAETLNEYFPTELLPTEYGGKQTNGSSLHNDFVKRIESIYKDWMTEHEELIADEKARTGKPRKEIIGKELEGSFRKLDID